MTFLYLLDLIGTFVFAVSGVLTAAKQKLDIFGAAVIAFVTAVGGGTIRDLLIDSHPIGWMRDLNYLYIIWLAIPISFFFRAYIQRLRKTMFLFDTIGIGLFTVLGIEKTLSFGLSPIIAVLMGTVSAVFGGVVRDTLCNEVPLIFRKEFYATACIAGGVMYFALRNFIHNEQILMFCTVLFIISIRLFAVKYKWALPTLR